MKISREEISYQVNAIGSVGLYKKIGLTEGTSLSHMEKL